MTTASNAGTVSFDDPSDSYKISDKGTVGFRAATQTWPVVITRVIDDVHRTIFEADPNGDDSKVAEGKKIIQGLSSLKYELQHNKQWRAIADDGLDDLDCFNGDRQGTNARRWMDLTYLYAETYMYRRIWNLFFSSSSLKRYDPFTRSKTHVLEQAEPTTVELVTRYNEIVAEVQDSSRSADSNPEVQEKELYRFKVLCRSGLGERITKSRSGILSQQLASPWKSPGGLQLGEETDAGVLVDESLGAYMALIQARESDKPERVVHIILGGVGLELLADVILSSYLLESNLATKIVLQPKAIPFGMESTAEDLKSLLSFLVASSERVSQQQQQSPDTRHVNCLRLQQRIQDLFDQGKMVLRPNTVWSNPMTGCDFGVRYPDLCEELKAAELVVVKGDFLYRKFLADSQWPYTTPFRTALGPLGRGSGIRILALRPIRSDILVGVDDPDVERAQSQGGKEWKYEGRYAVMQFSDGKA